MFVFLSRSSIDLQDTAKFENLGKENQDLMMEEISSVYVLLSLVNKETALAL